MQVKLSERMCRPDFQGEFVDTMLKGAVAKDLISFGGGLPNPISFPVKEMESAVAKVLERSGVQALQYSTTAGYGPLRAFIAARYALAGVPDVKADDILVTNGSQQALDMFAACLLDPGDELAVEDPTYLAALQTFHLYGPKILTVPLNGDGLDTGALAELLAAHAPKFMYLIPNFQNPTGLTYTPAVRAAAAALFARSDCFVIEDNPYGELRFRGEGGDSFGRYLGEQCCMMGTFSKVVSPGMRIGWICCRQPELRKKLLAYKMTMDLHTNIFCQMVLAQYLEDNDLDAHIARIRDLYRDKADLMMACMDRYLPRGCSFTRPEGGMFIWATMPEGVTALEVQREVLKKGVLVTAGDPFYESQRNVRTMRINYSNSADADIEKGIRILGETIAALAAK